MSSRGESIALRAHGGLVDAELSPLSLSHASVLDLSVNVNPYGPTAAMLDAIRGAPVDRYPDPTSRDARAAVGEAIGASPDRIVIGNGAVDLMWTLVRAFVSPDTKVAVVEPTFSELRAAATLAGARIAEWRAREADAFRVDLDAVLAAARGCDLLYLCSPANPTGRGLSIDAIAALAARAEGALVILDESFLSLSDRHADRDFPLPPNVVRVRSLTKDHAIPGLRAGYLVTTEPIARRIEASRPPWTTSAPAQAAVIAAMREATFVAESRERLRANRERLRARLRERGFDTPPSIAPYLLVPVGDATALRARLLARHRLLVRDCASFGLSTFIRVCARPRMDEDRFLAALDSEVRP